MARRRNNPVAPGTSAATVGYEAELWRMADALRGSVDAAEYKHRNYNCPDKKFRVFLEET